jgi:hypothetical protein
MALYTLPPAQILLFPRLGSTFLSTSSTSTFYNMAKHEAFLYELPEFQGTFSWDSAVLVADTKPAEKPDYDQHDLFTWLRMFASRLEELLPGYDEVPSKCLAMMVKRRSLDSAASSAGN